MNASRPQARRLSTSLSAAAAIAVLASAVGACSEPAPIIARGAWAIQWVDTGPNCQIAGHNLGIGEVDADTRQTLVEDQTESTTIGCTVIDNGGSFYFDAAASNSAGVAITMVVPEIAASATSADTGSTGTVSYRSPNTAEQFSSDKCVFYFADGTPQGATPGNIFLTFECPEIAAAVDNVCAIQTGYAAFENCSSKDEE